jgi:FkbM family methyltransferase
VREKLKFLLVGLIRRKTFAYITDFVVRTITESQVAVRHGDVVLKLAHPNPQIRSRNNTFSSKEPETLSWIDSFAPKDVLWDLGANVGLYSVYAGLRGVIVYAFEPSVFNLEFLVRNIHANSVTDAVGVIPIAVGTQSVALEELHLPSTAWGDSQNTITPDLAYKSQVVPTEKLFGASYRTVGVPLDEIATMFKIPPPTHLKIDVDGIEATILETGPRLLTTIQSVLVEVPLSTDAASRITQSLTRAGLRHSSTHRQNQIWCR